MERRKKVKDIAHDFGVGLTAVYNWINIYEMKGINGLNLKKAPGAVPKLSKEEIKKLLNLLKKTADNYGFESPLWECKR